MMGPATYSFSELSNWRFAWPNFFSDVHAYAHNTDYAMRLILYKATKTGALGSCVIDATQNCYFLRWRSSVLTSAPLRIISM